MVWRALVVLCIVGGVWLAAFSLHEKVEQAPTTCLFRIVTGKPCPTCGMTRATCALAHGEWSTAMAYHPLVIPFWLALLALLGTHLVMPASAPMQRWRQFSLWAFLAVVGAGLLLRMGEWAITAF